jgi:hypothetical protein
MERGSYGQRPSRGLINALRASIDELERNIDLAPDDRVLVDIERAGLRRAADQNRFSL